MFVIPVFNLNPSFFQREKEMTAKINKNPCEL